MVPVSAASLRASFGWLFPFLLGGTFIEARKNRVTPLRGVLFPFLLGGTFIEAERANEVVRKGASFPFLLGGTFIEAYKQRIFDSNNIYISLPFGRDFH